MAGRSQGTPLILSLLTAGALAIPRAALADEPDAPAEETAAGEHGAAEGHAHQPQEPEMEQAPQRVPVMVVQDEEGHHLMLLAPVPENISPMHREPPVLVLSGKPPFMRPLMTIHWRPSADGYIVHTAELGDIHFNTVEGRALIKGKGTGFGFSATPGEAGHVWALPPSGAEAVPEPPPPAPEHGPGLVEHSHRARGGDNLDVAAHGPLMTLMTEHTGDHHGPFVGGSRGAQDHQTSAARKAKLRTRGGRTPRGRR